MFPEMPWGPLGLFLPRSLRIAPSTSLQQHHWILNQHSSSWAPDPPWGLPLPWWLPPALVKMAQTTSKNYFKLCYYEIYVKKKNFQTQDIPASDFQTRHSINVFPCPRTMSSCCLLWIRWRVMLQEPRPFPVTFPALNGGMTQLFRRKWCG